MNVERMAIKSTSKDQNRCMYPQSESTLLQIELWLAGIDTILRKRSTQVLHRESGSSFIL